MTNCQILALERKTETVWHYFDSVHSRSIAVGSATNWTWARIIVVLSTTSRLITKEGRGTSQEC